MKLLRTSVGNSKNGYLICVRNFEGHIRSHHTVWADPGVVLREHGGSFARKSTFKSKKCPNRKGMFSDLSYTGL